MKVADCLGEIKELPEYPSNLINYIQVRSKRRKDIEVSGMSKTPTFFKSPEMAKKFPLHPKHPERTCWGCDKYCSVDSLQCGNGSGRTQHPAEMLGDDWYKWGDWGIDSTEPSETGS